MKIIRLSAENIKRIKAVEIEPRGNVVKISGKNDNGKTSVLDAIWYALDGRKSIPDRPVRDGESRARVELDLGDFVVERRWTSNDTSYLNITSKDGTKYQSPQKMLDKIIGELSFDPLEFVNMDKNKQIETIIDAVDIHIDTKEFELVTGKPLNFIPILDEFRSAVKTVYDERTLVNRDISNLESRSKAIEIDETQVVERIPVLSLIEQRRGLQITFDEMAKKLARVNAIKSEVQKLISEMETLTVDLKSYEETPEEIDFKIKDIDGQLSRAEDVNKIVDDIELKRRIMVELIDKRRESQTLTARLEAISDYKERLISETVMPIPGLGFNDDGVTYKGIPFGQLSRSEQIKISMAVAMALNPELRVIRVTDGSLLDSDSMAVIESLAEYNDYQVWIEVVDGSGKVGIYIEDGQVKNQNG